MKILKSVIMTLALLLSTTLSAQNITSVHGMISRTKIHEERVEVVKVLLEVTLHLTRGLCEVNDKISSVFVLGKFLGNPALADSSCAVQHDGGLTVAGLFPLKQSVVYLSFHLNSFVKTGILYHINVMWCKWCMVEFKGLVK